VLVVDGKPLSQIMAIIGWLVREFPDAGLLPADPWARAQALSQLAWMNTTPHTTFTRIFFPERYAESEGARAEVKKRAAADFRSYLERVQGWVTKANPYWLGERISFHDAYAFTLLRWGGFAGIDPKSLPAYHGYIQRVTQHPAVAAALARERIALDTYKG
jgi:glutathione S-transferase